MAYSGLAIADYFIEKSINEKPVSKPITNMAVLKMIYFAQELSFPIFNERLIKDAFY
ncbi:hypothetical protein EZS27_035702, partial [termite gut metagenome]